MSQSRALLSRSLFYFVAYLGLKAFHKILLRRPFFFKGKFRSSCVLRFGWILIFKKRARGKRSCVLRFVIYWYLDGKSALPVCQRTQSHCGLRHWRFKNDCGTCVWMLASPSMQIFPEFGVFLDTKFNFCCMPLVRHS